MMNHSGLNNGIPISISLQPVLEEENIPPGSTQNKWRILMVSLLAVVIGGCTGFIAKFLVCLINLSTNISFYHRFSMEPSSPSGNTLGIFVVIVPAIGGIIVGLMAFYGSKAIRGHGIPEAMEQILTNDSKIKPAITYLKPISSAIAIGTGGPFGAEGPIIATGGAFGSTLGQLLKITHNERKILLASGAAAGMAAIFGSPVAAVFLAIELLLFEFSPRSVIPVVLACITGAAAHHFLFGSSPVFAFGNTIGIPADKALFFYSILGVIIGVLSVLVTKIVYYVEDIFEKLPVHWVWWPAIGGLFVGIIGYFAPATLGVGYENITHVLSGSLPVKIMLSLCLLKFVSWAIALASGTSGGTLAPLLTIGGAAGALLGTVIIYLFPGSGVVISLAALVGMSAMFAGASRALLTSIIFALETTGQFNALLPLLAACTGSFFISFFLMENTIMTEKIAHRGVKTPDVYEPDILEQTTVAQVVNGNSMVLNEASRVGEVRQLLGKDKGSGNNYYIVVSDDNIFRGILSASDLFDHRQDVMKPVGDIVRKSYGLIKAGYTLKTALEMMLKENADALPVMSSERYITGVLSSAGILSVYKTMAVKDKRAHAISVKRRTMKIFVKGLKLVGAVKKKG